MGSFTQQLVECVAHVSKNNRSTCRVHVNILYPLVFTHNGPQVSVPPGVYHSSSVSPSHFPTEFLTPSPRWLLASFPTHINAQLPFGKAAPTPAISIPLPEHLHGNVIDRFRAGRPFQPMMGQSLVFMCRNGGLGVMVGWMNTV